MNSKEALKELKEEGIYLSNSNVNEVLDAIEKDLELLDCFLNCFKSSILEATNNQNRRGNNIIADKLKDELGLIILNKLKERLENV